MRHRKPSDDMLSSAETLRELRRQEPTFRSMDQLWRTGFAILPPWKSHISGMDYHVPRYYTDRDVELILVAHRLRMALSLRYEALGCLARNARRKQLDEIAVFAELLEQARIDQGLTEPADADGSEQLTA